MPLYPVAGDRLYIGGVLSDKKTDFVATDFDGQTWIEVDGWSQSGPVGDGAQEIATDLINRGRTIVQKGTRRSPAMENMFAIVPGDPGQAALIAAERTKFNYAFRIVRDDPPLGTPKAATITIADPAVVSVTTHGWLAGQRIQFSTSGQLPEPLVPGTDYYLVPTVTTGAFSIAHEAGGTAIETTGSQSGVHNAIGVGLGSQRLFIGLVMGATEQGGNANTIKMLQSTIGVNSNIVRVGTVAPA
jgi:hypothetical protein